MTWEIFRFECRFQLRSPLFLIVSLIFFLFNFFAMASESVTVGDGTSNLNLNAAFTILQTQYVFSIIGMFAAIAFVAGAITRDYEAKTAELFFASGVSEKSYLFGRFAGGFLFATLAILAGLLGTLVATFMPWLDPERIGEFDLAPYWFGVYGVIVPNMFVVCALFFSVSALTRSILAAYVAALAFMITYVVLSAVTDQESLSTMALADPFGITAFAEITRYWTVFDRNYLVPEFAGTLLANRLIWGSVGILALLATAARYGFSLTPSRLRLRRRKSKKTPIPAPAIQTVVAHPRFDFGASVAQFASQLRMDIRGIVRSVPFYVLLAFGIMNVLGGFYAALTQSFGTPVYPLTAVMILAASGSFLFVILIVLIYYSGELVHRERQTNVADIIDATPYPNGIMILSKIGALWFIVAALLGIVTLASILVQAFNDYYRFELDLYFTRLFGMIGSSFFLFAVLGVFIQVLAKNKFIGMISFLVVFIVLRTLSSFGFEHNLYLFNIPSGPYSDMNGFGHFVPRTVAFGLYWSAVSVLMVTVAHLLFRRGHYDHFRERMWVARERLNTGVISVALVSVFAFSSIGSWIYYNTNVLNDYLTQDDREKGQADYEKAYKQYEGMAFPDLVDLEIHLDIYPEERRLESRGSALLVNNRSEPIAEIHLSLPIVLTINAIDIPDSELVEENGRLGYYRYALNPPMQPGDEITMRWDLSWINEGFPNSGSTTRVVGNGTFVNNTEIMPLLGYDAGEELGDNNKRREYDLPPVERLPKFGDPAALHVNQLGVSLRTNFRTVISTAADQIAIAPGYLQREWEQDGRRYFEYEMDQPIWPFVSFTSARYSVVEEHWKGVDLKVFYHEDHAYNVDAMMDGSKKALDYFNREFTPYQYRQFRIIEFPSYQSFAQSFPNTIPFSEAIGFVADLRDEKNINYVFYVTAHELAHQWWAHQAIGARMQGMTVIVETLAQYSALMVMEKEYGPEMMRRFLKYELDIYLQSRGGELIEELPLMYSENQPYIHYRKGSVVMYALKDAIGEAAVNQALRNFLAKFAFKSGPFPTAGDLVAEFRVVAGDEHQELITDLFEKIILFDVSVTEADVKEVEDGFEVTMVVSGRKLSSDGEGKETEVPLASYLDVAIFPEATDDLGDDDLPEPLIMEKRLIKSGEQTFTYTVSERPARVGVDPYNKMIDRNPDDNLRRI